MLPIMLTHQVKQRLQMIEAALEARAPKTYRELKKSRCLQSFLEEREKQIMESFDPERGRILMETHMPDGGDPLAVVGEANQKLLSAWNQTLETYLDFSD